MAVKIEEFVAYLGWEVDPGKLDEFKSQVSSITDIFKYATVAIAGAASALTALTVITNKQTSVNAQLAQSVGLSAESLENWTYLLGAVNLNSEQVVKSVQDLNIRLGQAFSGLGDAQAVQKAVRALNLEFNDLKNLAPEQQYKTILNAAKDLEDQQTALAVAQQLFGESAVRIVGYLRNQEGSVEDLLEEQAKFNLLTEEARESAIRFTGLWDNFSAVIDSSKASISGFLGEAISPLLRDFLGFIKANNELIKSKLKEWAEQVGKWVKIAWEIFKNFLDIIRKVIDSLGGFANVIRLISVVLASLTIYKLIGVFQALIPLIGSATFSLTALKTVLNAAKPPLIIALIGITILAIQDLITWFRGGETVLGKFGESIAEWADAATGKFAAFFGLTKEEFQLWLVQTVDGIVGFVTKAWELITGFFAELFALDWQTVADRWLEIFGNMISSIKGFFTGLLDYILMIPDKITAVFNDLIKSVLRSLKDIPLIGELIEKNIKIPDITVEQPVGVTAGSVGRTTGLKSFVESGISTAEALGEASRTVASTAASNVQNIQNIMQQKIGSRTENRVTNTWNITQQTGESGEQLARRITGLMEESMAIAVRNTDRGVEY